MKVVSLKCQDKKLGAFETDLFPFASGVLAYAHDQMSSSKTPRKGALNSLE
jgi:hypothetical protein